MPALESPVLPIPFPSLSDIDTDEETEDESLPPTQPYQPLPLQPLFPDLGDYPIIRNPRLGDLPIIRSPRLGDRTLPIIIPDSPVMAPRRLSFVDAIAEAETESESDGPDLPIRRRRRVVDYLGPALPRRLRRRVGAHVHGVWVDTFILDPN